MNLILFIDAPASWIPYLSWTSAWDEVVCGAVVGRVCDGLSVRYDREVYRTYQVHNEAIVIPENIGAIRALTGFENAEASIEATQLRSFRRPPGRFHTWSRESILGWRR